MNELKCFTLLLTYLFTLTHDSGAAIQPPDTLRETLALCLAQRSPDKSHKKNWVFKLSHFSISTPFILWLIQVILTWRKISLLTVEQHKSWCKDFPNWLKSGFVPSAAVVSVPDSVEQRKDKQWAMPLQSGPSAELKRGFVLWLVWRAERPDVLPCCSFSRSLGAKGHGKVEEETLFSP